MIFFINLKKRISEGADFIIPPVVFYEIRRGLLTKDRFKRYKTFEELCESIAIGDFTFDVWAKSTEIFADLQSSQCFARVLTTRKTERQRECSDH